MQKQLLILGTVLAVTAAGVIAYTLVNGTNETPMVTKMSTPEYDLWVHWQNKHGKKYSSKEHDYRMSVFHQNYQKIKSHMSNPDRTYDMDFNQFMDLTQAEFSKFYLGYKGKVTGKVASSVSVSSPSSVDWRGKGVITPIKNQGQCGSCWAFSTTGSVEGLYAQTYGTLKSFSEQQLVDCSKQNSGCNGGLMDEAFQYVEQKGLETESQYPYEGVDGSCEYQAAGDFKITGYQDVAHDESALKAAIAIRPTSIAVDAQSWSFYSGGVFSNCGTSLDHGVLAVGYTDSYWIVKNSWGASWGEQGFIRLAMGNTCGILNSASYPTV